jgi:hypothetical protein
MNAPRLDVRGSGEAFAVMLDGRRVSMPFNKPELAWAAAARLERALRTTTRACLCCAAAFPSEGPHNRLCNHCRQLGWPR